MTFSYRSPLFRVLISRFNVHDINSIVQSLRRESCFKRSFRPKPRKDRPERTRQPPFRLAAIRTDSKRSGAGGGGGGGGAVLAEGNALRLLCPMADWPQRDVELGSISKGPIKQRTPHLHAILTVGVGPAHNNPMVLY